MAKSNARSAAKVLARRAKTDPMSFLFLFCTVVMLGSVVRMWAHGAEICDVLGASRGLGILGAVTGAALIVSWWVNTGNE